MRSDASAAGRVLVWDAVVRLCHAGLAASCLLAWVLDGGGPLHRGLGYAAAAFVALRLVWAGIARGHAGLRALKPSLAGTGRYAAAVAAGRGPRHLGHDPLGVWMVWYLWLVVLLLGLTGWMSRLDAFWGDDGIRAVHAALADALAVGVVLHWAGVALMSWQWRENLAASMVTGHKRRGE